MGVIREVGNVAAAKGGAAADFVKDGVQSEMERCKAAMEKLVALLPEMPLPQGVLESTRDQVTQLIEKIQETEVVAWSQEKLYKLYMTLIGALENMISMLAPLVAEPMLQAREALVDAKDAITQYVQVTFDKLDDQFVTPAVAGAQKNGSMAYSLAKDFATSKYESVKEEYVTPAVAKVNSSLVTPVVEKASAASAAASTAAADATSKAIKTGAWLDERLSLIEMMWMVVDKSKKMDQRVSGGRVEEKIVKPMLEKAESLDAKYLNGKSRQFLDSTVTEFYAAKEGAAAAPAAAAGSPSKKNKKKSGVTAQGPPVIRNQPIQMQ